MHAPADFFQHDTTGLLVWFVFPPRSPIRQLVRVLPTHHGIILSHVRRAMSNAYIRLLFLSFCFPFLVKTPYLSHTQHGLTLSQMGCLQKKQDHPEDLKATVKQHISEQGLKKQDRGTEKVRLQ